MQTTLDCNNPSSPVKVETRNWTDEYIDYLWKSSPEGITAHQIEQHIQEEKKEIEEIKEEFEYLQQFPEFRPQPKPQEYIRVGKHGKTHN